jgi:hypothetical protein
LDLLTGFIDGKPLTEAQLLAICHSPTSDLVGDHRLTLRRIGARGKRSKALHQIFGETPPIPATPGLGESKFPILQIKHSLISVKVYPEDEDLPPSPKFDRTFSTDQADLENIRQRKAKRASTVSVLSGLGVDLDKLDAHRISKPKVRRLIHLGRIPVHRNRNPNLETSLGSVHRAS